MADENIVDEDVSSCLKKNYERRYQDQRKKLGFFK
jgi:hypothetical protein